MTIASFRVYAGVLFAVAAAEANLESEEGERGTVFRERTGPALGGGVRLSAIPTAVITADMIVISGPSRNKDRNTVEMVAAPMTKISR